MTQRTLAGLLAVPLLVALWVQVLREPLPYVVYSPGLTVDVLGTTEADGQGDEIIEVEGAKTYRDDGQLRMTTVLVSQPDTTVTLPQLIGAWFDGDDAIYPYASVYAPDDTDETQREEGAFQMATSQDAAIASALVELGYDVNPTPVVAVVEKGTPADGELREGDHLVSINDREVTTVQEAAEAVDATGDGEPVQLTVNRKGKRLDFAIPREQMEGGQRIGIQMRDSFRFPVDVTVGVDPQIGGPSAGLMFSLGIYDTLTPGSMTGGEVIAGTGTIAPDGTVGPIGGIDQKIAGARDDGAQLFLVPADNCDDAVDAPAGDMRLTRVSTMSEAVDAVEAWAADPDTDLPQCTAGGGAQTQAAGEH
ncbi:PDZ domain-containing protein [Nocardioides aestuarii]|uniref:endopeptidase La n=1 Tax=Nocardioides aestuarii TaxID=252231 RepID=A0ABW4TQR4_9ACTN